MLIKFKVKNFRSFKEEAVLDMRRTSIRDLEDTIIKGDKGEDLLSIAAIYGANASGKSNLIDALKYMFMATLGERNSSLAPYTVDKHEYSPFLFDKSTQNAPMEFELDFYSEQKEFRYGFSIKDDKFIHEYLYETVDDEYQTIFDRNVDNNTLELSEDLIEFEGILSKIKDETNVLKELGSNYNIVSLDGAFDWIHLLQLYSVLYSYYDSNEDNFGLYLNKIYLVNDKISNEVLKYIKAFDNTIEDIEFEFNNEKISNIFYIRNVNGNRIRNSIKNESSGTRKMFRLAYIIFASFENNIPVILDEIDSNIHPLLLRTIIQLFHSRDNDKSAQLITTLHDISVLNKDCLRRDEVWFVSKDENSVSEIYSLVELKNNSGARIRNDATFYKDYLNGYYGAVPSLKELM